ncbi:MAG: hypothetical protein JWR63_1424 [Conexibacter sp.]|nr:hypothetical protein [Conexibacter sp.]
METQTQHWRTLVGPILFTLLCVSLLIAGWRAFGGSTPLQARDLRLHATFPQANNLYRGSDVRIAGVSVGRVVQVARVGLRARVTFSVRHPYVPVRRGARLLLRTKTLLGEAYLELVPGARTAAAVPENGWLAVDAGVSPQRLDQVLSTFDPPTREAFRQFTGGLASAVAGRGSDLSAGLAGTADLASGLDDLTGIVDRNRVQVGRLVAGAGDVLSAAGEREGEVQAAVRSGRRVLDTTAGRSAALGATVQRLPGFLKQLHETADAVTGLSGDLTAATSALVPAAPRLAPALDQLDRAAPQFEATFRELRPTLRAGDTGLPALAGILRAARPAVPKLDNGFRQIIPIVQLVAADAPTLVGSIGNPGAALNGTMVVDDTGRAAHFASGVPTFWNEAVGGWVKRLPSNRQNPYPKPQSGLDVGSGGLKAFDCRNLGNPPYLQPFGGVPDCRTQGAWTFNGKSAYYPRLLQAAPSPPSSGPVVSTEK